MGGVPGGRGKSCPPKEWGLTPDSLAYRAQSLQVLLLLCLGLAPETSFASWIRSRAEALNM